METLIVVITTNDDQEELESIANALVQYKLAACCQISSPITSVYTWEGKTETTQEWTCWIKTTQSRFKEVAAAIQNMHHYDVPQIIAVEAIEVDDDYRKWVQSSTDSSI